MVDVMAPVFDHLDEGEDAPLRPRRAGTWQRDAWGIEVKARGDGGDGDDGHDDGHDDDDDKDHPKDDDKQRAKVEQGDEGDGVLGIDPLNPLPAVASLIAPSAPELLRTGEQPTLTSEPPAASSHAPPPTPPANNPGAVNPQVPAPQAVTTSSVTITTTTPLSTPSTGSKQSLVSALPSPTSAPSPSPTAAFEIGEPSPTIYISDSGNNLDGDYRDGNGPARGPPPGGLSPTAEDVLISAGSIGAFILICFVCWMGWRAFKKSKRAQDGVDGDDFSPPNALLARIPYFGRNQRRWQDLDDSPEMRGSPPMYDQATANSMGPEASMHSMTQARHMAHSPAKQVSMTLPRLDTNLSYSNTNPFSASTQSSMLNPQSAHSPQGMSMPQQQQPQQPQPPPVFLPQLQTNFGPTNASINPFASPEDALVPNNFSPNSAAQYGNGTMQTIDTATTDRSRMPDPYYNQSELARQASTAFDPTRRAVYRASELSSISSGFGDGDIIVPPPVAGQQGQGHRPFSFVKAPNVSRNHSVATRSEAGSTGQRDTVYTTTSEDMPVRYRSVHSWVDQQTGRIQRQQERDGDDDVPPVPTLPPEERLTMMMDDGEEPRRYEDTLSSQTLPQQRVTAEEGPRKLASSSNMENARTEA